MAYTQLLPQKRSDQVVPQPFVDTTGEFERAFDEAKRKELEAREALKKKQLEKPKNIKKYLVCIHYLEGGWDVQEVTGQQTARETLKEVIDEIDLERSFVLVEDVPFGEGKVSAYDFLILIEGNYSDGFDVRDHLLHPIGGETEQQEEDDKAANYFANGDVVTYEKYQSENAYAVGAKEIR